MLIGLPNKYTYKKILNFLAIAKERAKLSPDRETKVGAILIDTSSLDIIATGYNGFIRESHNLLPVIRPDKYQYMIHAETNLIYNILRRNIAVNTKNVVLFCTHSPCENCLRSLYQSGIKRIIFKTKHHTFKDLLLLKDLAIDFESNKQYTILRISNRR